MQKSRIEFTTVVVVAEIFAFVFSGRKVLLHDEHFYLKLPHLTTHISGSITTLTCERVNAGVILDTYVCSSMRSQWRFLSFGAEIVYFLCLMRILAAVLEPCWSCSTPRKDDTRIFLLFRAVNLWFSVSFNPCKLLMSNLSAVLQLYK